MKKYVRSIICLLFTNIKFLYLKMIHFSDFKYSLKSICSPFSEVEIRNGKLRIGSSFKMRSNTHVRVRKDAELIIGDNVSLNYGDMIVCHEKIAIGDNVQIAPNVMIYDHDHDFRAKNGLKHMAYKSSPIIIGNNVWIGANTVILRGTIIEDNCVIGAGSVVKDVVSKNSIYVQKKDCSIIQINEVDIYD